MPPRTRGRQLISVSINRHLRGDVILRCVSEAEQRAGVSGALGFPSTSSSARQGASVQSEFISMK